MTDVNQLITEHLDIWTSATEKRASAGRGNGGPVSLFGIKKLRELILELAVRGKLVPQDKNDEVADALLERLHDQQSDMFARGIIKKPKPAAKIAETETPFELPTGWKWCRVSELGHDWGQKVPDTKFTYIDVGSINKELGLVFEPSELEAGEAPSRARKLVKHGTVIYSTVRPYLLNIAVISEAFEPEPIASTAFAIVHPFEGVSASYLYRYFRSPTFISYVESCQTGIAYPAINDKQFFSGLVPLPPTAEQHRIVAKVDELMVLCDALEQQTEDSLKAHLALVETCLATLTNSQSPKDLAENWTRIEAHFDTLFTTERSLVSLETGCLELAVTGKLVQQDPSEPEVDRALLRPDKLAEKFDLSAFNERSKLFSLPQGWIIEPLSRVASHIVDCPHTTPKWTDDGELCVKSEQVFAGRLDLSNPNYVSRETYIERIDRLEPQTGDILYKREGGILGVGSRIPDGKRVCLGQRLMLIRAGEVILPDFLELVINSPWTRRFAKEKTTGGAAPRVNMTVVRAYPIPVPPLREQARIVQRVRELEALLASLRDKIIQSKRCEGLLADALTSRMH